MRRRKEKPPTELRTEAGIVQVGGLVRYYRDGWYYGHLDSVSGAMAKIRPIGPKNVAPRLVTVPAEDIQAT